ncbi:MAG TPA: LPS assembly lipoprotein LptE [Burkholderiales bacterium]|nr:LPS assembly lipoprotein LptE [Burkholderiales bacterium]
MFTPVNRVLLAVFCLAVASCGFHLRGQATLPFDTVYVNADTDPSFAAELKRALLAGTNARVSDNPNNADAIFQLLGETRGKDILTVNTGGTVAEYELQLRVVFRVYNNKGRNWVPQTAIVLKRVLSYSDTAVLAFNDEEAQMYKDMQSDAVQQVVQRMSGANAPG